MSWFSEQDDKWRNAFGKLEPKNMIEGESTDWVKGQMPNWFGDDLKDWWAPRLTSSFTGGLLLPTVADYQVGKFEGKDSDEANKETLRNAGYSAGVLAAIFGGAGALGGEGGGSSGISTTGLEGTMQGSGATGTPISTFGGAESYPLASSETMAGMGLGGVEYGSGYTATPYAESVAGATGGAGGGFWDTLTESLGGMQGGQGGGQQSGGGGYDSILENMLKLSPWTVARRDPQRMAALLAMLRGQKQGGVLGY